VEDDCLMSDQEDRNMDGSRRARYPTYNELGGGICASLGGLSVCSAIYGKPSMYRHLLALTVQVNDMIHCLIRE